MLRSPLSATAILLSAALLGGCGDDGSETADDGQGGGSGTPSSSSGSGAAAADYTTAEGYCAASAARQDKCLEEPDDEAKCVADQECLQPIFAPGKLEAVWQCEAERPCAGKSDDACFDEVADQTTPPDGYDAYKAACDDKHVECAGMLSDDYCSSPYKLLTSAAYTALQPCFSEACADISACLRSVSGDCD